MSSSSDIEKLFEHFGGNATAYQEIGRENEARSARTRWPLLETLDLTQPAIPAIGQRRELKSQTPANIAQPAAVAEDTAPKDAASVTRAKAPLFTRSPRRDIPPVAVATPPTTPSGGSRFGVPETSSGAAAPPDVSPPPAAIAPGSTTSAIGLRALATPIIPPAVPGWAQAPAPTRAFVSAPAAPAQPASILGRLFARQPQSAPQQPATARRESAPLQAVFDRLRGSSAQPSAATDGAPRATAPNSWLVNGPRRS